METKKINIKLITIIPKSQIYFKKLEGAISGILFII